MDWWWGRNPRLCMFVMASVSFLTNQLRYSSNCYSGDDDDEAQHRQKRKQLLLVVWVEILRRREERIWQQNARRTYLTWSDLNPPPRIETPWQYMHTRGNDHAFITTMGIDVTTFEYILNQGFAETWNTTPIPHDDISFTALPHTDRRSLNAAGALGLTLHYLASTMWELSLQRIFSLIPLTVTCYLSFSLQILLEVLHDIPAADADHSRLICLPSNAPSHHRYKRVCKSYWDLYSAFKWPIWRTSLGRSGNGIGVET